MPTRAFRLSACALAAALALAACSNGEPDVAASRATNGDKVAPTAPAPDIADVPESPVPSSVPSAVGSLSPDAVVLAVDYRGAAVSGVDDRESVRRGEQVVIRVTSDVAVQVHLHGYDRRVDVPAGGTADLVVSADRTGTYLVELEGSSTRLFDLQVG